MVDLLHSALEYHERGLPIVLSPLGSKVPIGKHWHTRHWTPKEIADLFRERGEHNVGCCWGQRSGLIDLECDGSSAESSLRDLFDCGLDVDTPTFESKRGRHRLFRWNQELEQLGKATVHYGDLEVKLGAAGKGSQSLLPPSQTGDFRRQWLIGLDDCEPAELPRSAIQRLLQTPGSDKRSVYTETQEIACVSVSLCKPTDQIIADAIAGTIPTSFGHRHRRLFQFARLVRAVPALAGADIQSLRPLVQEWYRQALPKIGTKNFDETWADFSHAWLNIKFPAGTEPIKVLFQQAIEEPFPAIAGQYETREVQRLIVLCRALQSAAGAKPFYLACRTAGELLEISHVMANKWLRMLVIDKVLELITPGSIHRAAEYRYIGA